MRTFTIFKTAFLSTLLFFLFVNVSFAQCKLFEDFEANAWAGGNYTQRTVTDGLGSWTVSGVGTMDTNDRRIGDRSIRLRGNSGDNCHIQMNFDKPNGLGEVSFYYASYSGHKNGNIIVSYSTDGGANWTEAGSVKAPAWDGAMLKAGFTVNVPGNVRLKVARAGSLANSTSVNIDDICVTDFICSNCVSAPKFNPQGGYFSEPVNVTISSDTEGATIRYTTNGTDPTETSATYSSPISITEPTILKAKAWKDGMEASSISTAQYDFPQGITTLAALRALAPEFNGNQNNGTTVYLFTGRATLTHQQIFRNTKYIQDGTAAIVIDDSEGKITTKFNVGDVISNISCKLSNYFGMIRLIPVEDCDVVDYWGTVSPVVITASQFDFNHNNPNQAKVVTIKDVLYTVGGNFKAGAYYNLKENGATYDSVVYVEKYEADYEGTPIPTIMTSINGVLNFKGGATFATKNRIVPLDTVNKVISSISEINRSGINLSPNPANSYVDIITGTQMKLEVYSILGNLIHKESLHEGSNTISVSNYSSGVYVIKLIDKNSGKSFVQKLVIN